MPTLPFLGPAWAPAAPSPRSWCPASLPSARWGAGCDGRSWVLPHGQAALQRQAQIPPSFLPAAPFSHPVSMTTGLPTSLRDAGEVLQLQRLVQDDRGGMQVCGGGEGASCGAGWPSAGELGSLSPSGSEAPSSGDLGKGPGSGPHSLPRAGTTWWGSHVQCGDLAPQPQGLLLRVQGWGPHTDRGASPPVGTQRLPLRQRAFSHDVPLHCVHLRGMA